jgi:hypothetical protein
VHSSNLPNPKLIITMDSAPHSFNRRLVVHGVDILCLLYIVCSVALVITLMAVLAVAAVYNKPVVQILHPRKFDVGRMSLQDQDRGGGSSSGVSWLGNYV